MPRLPLARSLPDPEGGDGEAEGEGESNLQSNYAESAQGAPKRRSMRKLSRPHRWPPRPLRLRRNAQQGVLFSHEPKSRAPPTEKAPSCLQAKARYCRRGKGCQHPLCGDSCPLSGKALMCCGDEPYYSRPPPTLQSPRAGAAETFGLRSREPWSSRQWKPQVQARPAQSPQVKVPEMPASWP